MNLRTKTLLFFSLLILAFFSLGLILTVFIARENSQQEKASTVSAVQRAISVITNSQQELNTLAAKLAQWDDSYEFVQTQNMDYLESNFSSLAFYHNQLNLAAIIDIDQTVLFSQHYQWVTGQSEGTNSLAPAAMPDDLLNYLYPGSPFLSRTSQTTDTGTHLSFRKPDDGCLTTHSHL